MGMEIFNRLKVFVFVIALLFGISIIIGSCRKAEEDFTDQPGVSITEKEAKFFNNYRSTNVKEKVLVDFLKRKNVSLDFVGKTVERIGYPRWDKAITISVNNSTGVSAESENNDASVTYIPFARDSQNYVNASMAVYTSSSDTSFSYICDWQYSSYGFNTDADSTNAKDIFHLFTRLDNAVFGTTTFKITDNRLLAADEKQRIIEWGKDPDSVSVYYQLKSNNPALAVELLVPVETCTLYDVTITFDCPAGGGGGGGHGDCGPCLAFRNAGTSVESEPCWFSYQYEECTITWVNTGGGGGAGGNGGSGTGGGNPPGGGTPPTCHGGPVVAAKPIEPCGSGWEIIPIDDPPNDPCVNARPGAEKATTLSKNDKFISGLNAIKTLASDGKEHSVSLGKDANGNIIRSNPSTGTGNNASVPNIANRFADMHNHPNPKPPSSGDIYGFIDQAALKGSGYQRFVTLPDGTMYALIITDMEAAKKFNADYPRRPGIGGNEPTFPADLVDELIDLNNNAGSQENGLAFFLDKHKTGISLLKLDTDEKFKRINVIYTGKSQYGIDTYNASLCN